LPPEAKEQVGYGRPPIKRRFKKGKSGNPRGRPKNKQTNTQIIEEIMLKPIGAKVDGMRKRISPFKLILIALRNRALRDDDLKAAKMLLNYMDKHQRELNTHDVNPQLEGLFQALMKGPVD
jgi:hypothetical protein